MNAFHRFGAVAASFTLLAGLSIGTSHAQSFPTKPITIVVPFAPGGVTDLAARQLAGHMQAQSPQPVVVENRPGATIDKESIRAQAAKQLSSYKVPRVILVMEAAKLPLLSSTKVDRRLLVKMLSEEAALGQVVVPSGFRRSNP